MLVEHALDMPLRWKRPRRIFVNSMSDLFHEGVPDEWIDRIFAVMALAPQHTFQVLTKRSARMRTYLQNEGRQSEVAIADAGEKLFRQADPSHPLWGRSKSEIGMCHCEPGLPLPNVWLGVSAEDQQRAEERVPDLIATPAAVRFVSAEPLLGPIDFRNIPYPSPPEDEGRRGCVLTGHEVAGMVGNCIAWIPPLDWIIVGGESGPRARPMHPSWASSIRDQCEAAGVPFFFKQWGEWSHSEQVPPPVPGPRYFDVYGRPVGDGWHFWTDGDRGANASIRVGKKAAGRLLDGRTHDAMPITHQEGS